jgi:L-asparaginase II
VITGVVRSGIVESRHPVTVAVADSSGRLIALSGERDVDRVFFMRSTAKPFQAAVSQRHGAALVQEQMAVVAGSHAGQPVHVSLVRGMLGEVGLDEQSLVCPPAWPASRDALCRLAAAGVRAPLRVLHNCSGKHAGMLRACIAQGWPLAYSDAGSRLQRAVAEYMRDVTGGDVSSIGVDGCGVPTFAVTVRGMARAYARLAVDGDLAEVADAMSRLAALTSDGDRAEAKLACWSQAAVKGGAEACLGVAWFGGLGIAAKCWTGVSAPAAVAVIEVMRRLGVLPDYAYEMLAEVARPVVLGGAEPVGYLLPLQEGD